MGAENLPPTFAAITFQLAKMPKEEVESLAKKVAVLHPILKEATEILAKELKSPTEPTAGGNVAHINTMIPRAFSGLEEMTNNPRASLDEYLDMVISLAESISAIIHANVGQFHSKTVKEHCKNLGMGLVTRGRVNEIVGAIANTYNR